MTRSVLNLDLGAGPGQSMGGLALMRRPAQHHLGPVAAAWAHPYHGVAGLSVFYNSGTTVDPNAAPAPAPTPADLAARAAQQPPAHTPPAPLTQRINPEDPQVLIDKDTGQPMTQGRFSQIMTKQFDKSRRSAYREMAEAAGIPFDPENFDATQFGQLLKDAQEARQQAMTEEQRRAEELQRREQAIQAREAETAAKEKAAADRDRNSRIRAALVSLGATGADLDDAAALLRVADDATDDDITTAAKELADRRKEMFGGPATQILPPAPSGGPASGNSPRPNATSGKDAVREGARKRAEAMGLRHSTT